MDPNYYYTFNGFILHNLSEAPPNSIITAHARLLGGKGGFGSMLRAIGSQIEKTTNREMCRDLSGRRMRDVNNERRFKEWLDGAGERERERVEAYLEKRRKRRRLLEEGPSVRTTEAVGDCGKRQQIAEELQQAVLEAFEKRAKKNENNSQIKVQAKNISLGVDSDLESSDSSMTSGSSTPIKHDSTATIVISTVDDNKAAEDNNGEVKLVEEEEKIIKKRKIEIKHSEVVEEEGEGEDYNIKRNADEPINKKSKIEDEDITGDNSTAAATTAVVIVQESAKADNIDLEQYGSVCSLLTLDSATMKQQLQQRGLKCGGTLMEKAARLFAVRGLEPASYPPSLLAGAAAHSTIKTKKTKRK